MIHFIVIILDCFICNSSNDIYSQACNIVKNNEFKIKGSEKETYCLGKMCLKKAKSPAHNKAVYFEYFNQEIIRPFVNVPWTSKPFIFDNTLAILQMRINSNVERIIIKHKRPFIQMLFKNYFKRKTLRRIATGFKRLLNIPFFVFDLQFMIDTTGDLWAIDFSKKISYNKYQINEQKQDLMTLHYFAKESIQNLYRLKKIICKYSSCKHDCRLVNFNKSETIAKNFTKAHEHNKYGRECSPCYYLPQKGTKVECSV